MSTNLPAIADAALGSAIAPQPAAPLPPEWSNRRGIRRLESISADDLAKFLENLALTGTWYKSAEYCGLSYSTILRLKKEYPEFAVACEEALVSYRDLLVEAAHDRAINGWDEPVFSQRLGTEIGRIRKFDSRLHELLLKRHDAGFRDKVEIETRVSVGVLVAPVAAVSESDWEKRFDNKRHELAVEPVEGTIVPDDVKTP